MGRRTDFGLHLRRLAIAAALREAQARAVDHEAAGHRRRAARACREAEVLTRLRAAAEAAPRRSMSVAERVNAYVGVDAPTG